MINRCNAKCLFYAMLHDPRTQADGKQFFGSAYWQLSTRRSPKNIVLKEGETKADNACDCGGASRTCLWMDPVPRNTYIDGV